MKTFVLMSRLNPKGGTLVEVASTLRDNAKLARSWIDRAKKVCPEANFIAHYAILGSYDFMDIYEAPDEETAAKMAMLCGANGVFTVESWTAIPRQRMTELAEQMMFGLNDDDEP